jgi:hypothetical protein
MAGDTSNPKLRSSINRDGNFGGEYAFGVEEEPK